MHSLQTLWLFTLTKAWSHPGASCLRSTHVAVMMLCMAFVVPRRAVMLFLQCCVGSHVIVWLWQVRQARHWFTSVYPMHDSSSVGGFGWIDYHYHTGFDQEDSDFTLLQGTLALNSLFVWLLLLSFVVDMISCHGFLCQHFNQVVCQYSPFLYLHRFLPLAQRPNIARDCFSTKWVPLEQLPPTNQSKSFDQI